MKKNLENYKKYLLFLIIVFFFYLFFTSKEIRFFKLSQERHSN
jgi:hypothetical protein